MLTRILARDRDARASADAGVTLAELLLAMTLATIIGAMSVAMFLAVNTSADRTKDAAINTGRARATVLSWTNYLLVSDGTTAGSSTNRFEWIGANDMLFYANLNNRGSLTDTTTAPTMVWLRMDTAGYLVEEQFSSTATQGASPRICRRLAARVSTNRLFTPSAGPNDMSAANLGTVPSSGAGCQSLPVTPPSASGTADAVAVANLKTITSIGLDFTLAPTRGTTTQQFMTVATLPTLGGSL